MAATVAVSTDRVGPTCPTRIARRRCTAWADGQGLAADPFALAAMLDFRHHSVDGRLDYWTTTLVEEFLSSYALGLLFR
jgi:hypothetical protein